MGFFATRIIGTYFLILFLFIVPELSAQQNQVNKEKVSGDFYFRVGPSGIPVYPRGKGNNEHWETGINLKLAYETLEFDFTSAVIGAATFDSPERFQFTVGMSYKLPKNFSIQVVLLDAYAINNFPPPDPNARRPYSSVNSLWLGGRWDFEKNQNQISIFVRHEIRGDEPVLFTHFTKPYSSWHWGVASRSKFTEKTFLIFEPEVYASNDLGASRAVLHLGVERQLHDKLVVGGYYTTYRNIKIPSGTTDFRGIPLRKTADRLFFGFRIPFGDNR